MCFSEEIIIFFALRAVSKEFFALRTVCFFSVLQCLCSVLNVIIFLRASRGMVKVKVSVNVNVHVKVSECECESK